MVHIGKIHSQSDWCEIMIHRGDTSTILVTIDQWVLHIRNNSMCSLHMIPKTLIILESFSTDNTGISVAYSLGSQIEDSGEFLETHLTGFVEDCMYCWSKW